MCQLATKTAQRFFDTYDVQVLLFSILLFRKVLIVIEWACIVFKVGIGMTRWQIQFFLEMQQFEKPVITSSSTNS